MLIVSSPVSPALMVRIPVGLLEVTVSPAVEVTVVWPLPASVIVIVSALVL